MTRKTKQTSVEVTEAAVVTAPLSAKVAKLVAGITPDFKAFTEQFGNTLESRAELAPKFMRAARAWQEETKGEFVAFVRLIDPSLPVERKAYRAHAAYAAADYLRRLVKRAEAPGSSQANDPSQRAATPLEALSRVCAAILPLFGGNDLLWQALAAELHWSEAQVKRLQTLAKEAEPLLETHVPKPGPGKRPVLTYDASEDLAQLKKTA